MTRALKAGYREQVIADGAKHYWRLGATSGTVALDIVGGATGTIMGGVTLGAAGAIADGDPAMTFDGATGRISTTAPIAIAPPMTIEVWLKAVGSANVALGGFRFPTAGKDTININKDAIAIHLFVTYANAAAPNQSYSVAFPFDDGLWHSVVYVLAGGTSIACYIDAAVQALDPLTLTIPLIGIQQPVDIGYSSAHGAYWNGDLDEIAIYDRALTPAEIATHYALAQPSAAVAADTSAVDAALVALLAADPEFAALVPDGVYVDEAPPNSKRFAIVSRVPGPGDIATFGAGRAIEDYEFLIKVVMLSSANGDIRAAAARIDQLLEDQPLTIAGYEWMTSYRTEFLRMTEKDAIDPAIRWLHRGGRYRVQLAIAA